MDASTVASWLLEFSLRPVTLCVAALAAPTLLRVKSPAARHAIWSAVAGGSTASAVGEARNSSAATDRIAAAARHHIRVGIV